MEGIGNPKIFDFSGCNLCFYEITDYGKLYVTKFFFGRKIGSLYGVYLAPSFRSCQAFFTSPPGPFHHNLHGLKVVPLHLPVGYFAVSLCGLDPGMPQKVLDCDQVRIGVEQL